MYDIDRRAPFRTVGELKELIKDLPDDAELLICSIDKPYFHVRTDNSAIDICTGHRDALYKSYGDIGR